MSRKVILAVLLSATAAALAGACSAAPTAPRSATSAGVRHDDPPPDTTHRGCTGGLIGSGTC